MPQEPGQEADQRSSHAGHLDQQPKEYEQRHGEQDEVGHSLVHPTDHHGQRRRGGEREIADGTEAKGHRDGNSGEHAARYDTDEEDQEIEPAQPRII